MWRSRCYDADTDRFLILDVSRFKYPPVWVGPRNLFAPVDDGGDRNLARVEGCNAILTEN